MCDMRHRGGVYMYDTKVVCTCTTQVIYTRGGVYMYDTSHLHRRWCVHVRHKSSTQEVVCTCTTQVIYTRGGVYMYHTSHLHKRWCVHVRHKSSTQDHLRYKTLRSCVDVRHETSRWCADVERQDIYTGPGATCGHGDIFA